MVGVKKTPVVAVESGKVEFWTTSANAGCMLYLYGDSGTMYEYIHLNNDLTMKNDNRGKCVAGMAYAKGLKDRAHVQAGQMIGYLGDSGDANGIQSAPALRGTPRRRRRGVAVSRICSPRSSLLFFAKVGTPFTLALTGKVVSATDTDADDAGVAAAELPDEREAQEPRDAVDAHRAGDRDRSSRRAFTTPRLLSAYEGEPVVVWTQPASATTKAMLGTDGALTAALVQLG